MPEYEVSIVNVVTTESPVEAADEFREWLSAGGGADHGSVRVEGADGHVTHVDADGSTFDERKTGRWDFTVPDETAGATYRPWTNGWAVGFAVTDANGQERFIYLNPSGGSDDSVPNVFLYEGRSGDPLYDGASHHYDIDFS